MLHKGFDSEKSSKVTSALSGVACIPLRPQSIENLRRTPMGKSDFRRREPHREPYAIYLLAKLFWRRG